jgi:vancomycin resistance protein YoaR
MMFLHVKRILFIIGLTVVLALLPAMSAGAAGSAATGQPRVLFAGNPPLLILEYESKQWIFPLNEIGFDGIDPTTFDRETFMNWFSLVVEREVNRPPRSARYEGRRPVPHREGIQVDRRRFEQWLDHIHGMLGRPVTLPVMRILPALTTEKLLQLKEKRLATYTTWFNPRNVNRSHNIRLSARAIDHTIIMPGEIFSFNRTVGIRSIARGYRPARIIVKGEYSEGVGGGICQTSSTLFNSVDRAGLRIIQRVSHSKQVGYVPPKRDATVSWGGPDFRFQNQLHEPILIESSVRGGQLTISIYGPRSTRYMPRRVPSAPGRHPISEEEWDHVRQGPVKKGDSLTNKEES